VSYTPVAKKLLAKVTVSHALRNQLSLQFGASSTSTLTPQKYFYPFALVNKGGAFAFNGSGTEVEGSFYFDISSFLTATTSIQNQLYYLMAYDSVTGAPITVRSFEVIDPISDTSVFAASNVPMLIDGGSNRLIAGNYTPDTQAPSVPGSLTGSVTSQKRGKKVTVSVRLNWSASTDNVAVARYFVYRNGVKYAETTALSFTDSNTSVGVSYTYHVSAIDTSDNQSNQSNSVVISR